MHMTKTWALLLALAAVCGCQAQQETPAPATATATAAATGAATATATPLATSSPQATTTVSAAPATTAPPSADPPAKQTAAPSAKPPEASGAPMAGIYSGAAASDLNVRQAEVTDKGGGLYHIHAWVTWGFAHNIGDIDSDFRLVNGIYTAVDREQYPDVTASFAAGSLTIDYPDLGYGGMNAEPKGVYYLSAQPRSLSPYWTKLTEAAHVPADFRKEGLEAAVIALNDKDQKLVLMRFKGAADQPDYFWEAIVLHGPAPGAFVPLGDVSDITRKALGPKLAAYGFDADTQYAALRRDEYLRFIETLIIRRDSGEALPDDDGGQPLSEQEAFYIATGHANTTSVAVNRRDASNIGSIFKSEVDHSDADTVVIHIYEDVRNNATDEHTATLDWLQVDRRTGRVSGQFDE